MIKPHIAIACEILGHDWTLKPFGHWTCMRCKIEISVGLNEKGNTVWLDNQNRDYGQVIRIQE